MSLEEQIPRLLPWVHLHKVLLATALVQERDGNAIDAERALEASWSLGRAFENEKTLITRILGVSVERWQAGVLRKFREAPVPWIGRLADDEPWKKLGEALVGEGHLSSGNELTHAVWTKAMTAVADALPK